MKESLPHGSFLPWIEAEFGMDRRTASNFMRVAEQYSGKWETVSHLPPTALYELAAPKTPLEVREEVEKMATRIRDRAIRRAGELLKQIEPAHGANQNIKDGDGPKVLTRKEAGDSAGMSERQVKTAIRVANVPDADFERQVESPNPPTVTKLAEQGQKAAPRQTR